MNFFEVFFVIFSVLLVAGAGYFVYYNLPNDNLVYVPNKSEVNKPSVPSKPVNYDQSQQFYPNMRFSDRFISYSIESGCSPEKKDKILEALSLFEEKTVLRFSALQDGQISFVCSDLAPEPSEEGHFVAGEGGPSEIINTTLYPLILKGKVAFYREDKCSESKIAVHEVLHVLGFDHNKDPNSILFPTLDCDQGFDLYLIDEINRIYSADGMPDLFIDSLNASSSGKYLSFNIVVGNRGLKDTQDVTLGVYADDSLVKEFSLGELSVGTKKILNVENLKTSRYPDKVEFIVDKNNNIKEMYENNNAETLSLGN